MSLRPPPTKSQLIDRLTRAIESTSKTDERHKMYTHLLTRTVKYECKETDKHTEEEQVTALATFIDSVDRGEFTTMQYFAPALARDYLFVFHPLAKSVIKPMNRNPVDPPGRRPSVHKSAISRFF